MSTRKEFGIEAPPSPGRRDFFAQSAAGVAGAALGAAGLGSSAAMADDGEPRQRYRDKVVLITGATSGIGEATAHAFAREGARVFFCGRRESLGSQVQQAIREQGGEATYRQADVRDEDQVQAFVEACVETYGSIDVAFNNAGIEGPRGGLDEIDVDGEGSYRDVMRTNADGVFYGLRYEIPAMRGNGGVIVNTGSMLSHRGSTFAGAYAASKHAVIGLTRSAAASVAGRGIRVFSISPGAVETELLRRFLGGSLEGAAEDSPMGRMAQPSEIADAVLALSAPEALFLNGDDVKLDGASSAA
ncbi:SDR family NAD(P)-dependent oxidoreductase [Marinimicrobium sp. ABcell2]|uniref:SDR family NAD(P)-dependent oxidoreductase n=1 Tax=Marinimicrobium sp. ABcell2 TaxID=3069751 RepID=UPI0027B0522B|nr:SDR family oxidoreductase [Marinimicrobium sp. ABcell2]MDQ2078430.1 SDR family oxidoreductase [Marinimicrobium sp. ABcell2]